MPHERHIFLSCLWRPLTGRCFHPQFLLIISFLEVLVIQFIVLASRKINSSNSNYVVGSGASNTCLAPCQVSVKMAETWRVQYRTFCVTNPADRSATSKEFVEAWVRVDLDGGSAREDSSRSPSQRHHSRPGLRSRIRGPNSLDANFDCSGNTTEVAFSARFRLLIRHDYT